MTTNQNQNSVVDPTLKAHLSDVRSIGKGERLTETVTADIVATAPDGFDYKARGAVTGLIHTYACGEGERPATATGPKGDQTLTDYGRGVDRLRQSVRAAFKALEDTEDKAPEMRVSLKGVGSAVVPADHPAYALLLALMGADVPETDADETTDAPALAVAA